VSLFLNLIVIRANNLEESYSFYKKLGLSFNQEQHGNGPQHYTSELKGLVFEIYPAVNGKNDETIRIGFSVPNLDHVMDNLRSIDATIITEPSIGPWGKRAVVQDPDGHKVELVES
jgi:lactoylglutathione lyase